jgi:hypothetical protein
MNAFYLNIRFFKRFLPGLGSDQRAAGGVVYTPQNGNVFGQPFFDHFTPGSSRTLGRALSSSGRQGGTAPSLRGQHWAEPP